MNLSIIIINFNTADSTLKCLKSLEIIETLCHEVIVVDNNSDDNSVQIINERFSSITTIQNEENEGFGRANNLGFKSSSGEYLLLLNSDIIIESGSLEKCLEILRSNPSVGVLGCKLLNEDGSIQNSRYYHAGDFEGILKDNLLYNKLLYKKPTELKAVMGAFMLIPRHVFEKVGGFDPDFFMYAEEIELCHRIRMAGYKVQYTDEVKAIHRHGGSSEGSNWSRKQNLLSNALLYLKVKGVIGYMFYHALFQLTTITNLMLIWKLDSKYRKDFLLFQADYYSNFLYYLKIPFIYAKQWGSGKSYLKRS
jgi:GT2 family glycosyltransferase